MNPTFILLSQIRGVLQQNPRGLSIQEVAEKTGMNRNSASKYLEILRSRGAVDLQRFGNTKVYFPCERVPIAPILRFIRGAVAVVDFDLVVCCVNPACTVLLAEAGFRLTGLDLTDPELGPFSAVAVVSIAEDAVRGTEGIASVGIRRGGAFVEVEVSAVPVLLEDGRPGAALVLETEPLPLADDWSWPYGEIIREIAEPVCRFRPDGRVLWANRAFAGAAGMPVDLAPAGRNRYLGPLGSLPLDQLLAGLTPDRPRCGLEPTAFPIETSPPMRWTLYGRFDRGGRLRDVVATGHPSPTAGDAGSPLRSHSSRPGSAPVRVPARGQSDPDQRRSPSEPGPRRIPCLRAPPTA